MSHTPIPSSSTFLRRLLAAMSLTALAGCGDASNDTGDSGYECTSTYSPETIEGTTSPLDDGTCEASPDPDTLYFARSNYNTAIGECGEATLTGQAGDTCTYMVTCEVKSCCYGRPYLDEAGQVVLAGTRERDDWRRPVSVDTSALSDADRQQLVRFWLQSAQSEHSSVAGFHRFAMDLLAHGAPPELVRLAQEAAGQETEHAIACFSLASAYAGRGYGPDEMAMGQQTPVASTLAELAAWTLRDGAIGETVAAYGVAASLARAAEPAVRRALEQIVEEELQHAELAWRTLAWALDAGGQPVRDALQATFGALSIAPDPPERSTPATVAHGILPPAARHAAAQRCIDQVIAPAFAALMGTAIAA